MKQQWKFRQPSLRCGEEKEVTDRLIRIGRLILIILVTLHIGFFIPESLLRFFS